MPSCLRWILSAGVVASMMLTGCRQADPVPSARPAIAVAPIASPPDAGVTSDAGVTMPPADAAPPVIDGPTMPHL